MLDDNSIMGHIVCTTLGAVMVISTSGTVGILSEMGSTGIGPDDHVLRRWPPAAATRRTRTVTVFLCVRGRSTNEIFGNPRRFGIWSGLGEDRRELRRERYTDWKCVDEAFGRGTIGYHRGQHWRRGLEAWRSSCQGPGLSIGHSAACAQSPKWRVLVTRHEPARLQPREPGRSLTARSSAVSGRLRPGLFQRTSLRLPANAGICADCADRKASPICPSRSQNCRRRTRRSEPLRHGSRDSA